MILDAIRSLQSALGPAVYDSRVQIVDDNGSLVFGDPSPMHVSVTRTQTATMYEVEDGTTRSDHVVKNPIEITIDFIVDSNNRMAYEQIKRAFESNDLVTVQTKIDTYPSMLVAEMPHDESGEMLGKALMPVRFVEWRSIAAEYGEMPPSKVENKNQASTVKKGKQQAKTPSPSVESKAKGGAGTAAAAPAKKKGSIMSGWGLLK